MSAPHCGRPLSTRAISQVSLPPAAIPAVASAALSALAAAPGRKISNPSRSISGTRAMIVVESPNGRVMVPYGCRAARSLSSTSITRETIERAERPKTPTSLSSDVTS